VAERLLAADTLYSGVYDNKDPLFYYFVAAQRWTGGSWAELAAEVILIAIAAVAAYFATVKVSSQWTAAAVSLIAVPIIVTGPYYLPGFSELPGIALVLVAITAAAYNRPILAGSCIGLLVFMKLIFVPVAAAGVSCFLLMRQQFSEIPAIALAAFMSALAVVGLLFLRAELLPFMETTKLNIAYSQGALIGFKKGLPSLVEHIRRIGGWRFAGELAPVLVVIMLTLVIPSRGYKGDRRAQLEVLGVCLSTLVISLLVLSCIGLWPYHKQILYIPLIFAIVAVAPLIEMAAKGARALTLGLVCLTSYLMVGVFPWIGRAESLHASFAELSWVSPESQRLLNLGNYGTYARIGWADYGHAIGLRHWHLACPRFNQYVFDPEAVLNEVLECASTSPTLLISDNFSPLPRNDFWYFKSKDFVDKVEHLLNKSYSCDAGSGVRVCKRRGEYDDSRGADGS
jgi:hypothetical protein